MQIALGPISSFPCIYICSQSTTVCSSLDAPKQIMHCILFFFLLFNQSMAQKCIPSLTDHPCCFPSAGWAGAGTDPHLTALCCRASRPSALRA